MTLAAEPIRPHLVSFDTDSFARPVQRFVWEPVPVPPATAISLSGRRLLVLGEDAELAGGVADTLRAAGAEVDIYLPEVEPPVAAWDGIIDLNVTGRGYRLDDGTWRAALSRTTRMINTRYLDWQAEIRANRCCYVVVTAMGGLMGYRGQADQPLGGIWAGLAKSLLRELPNLAVKVVDVDVVHPDTVGAAVHAELSTWDTFEIGYHEGHRHALEARRREVDAPRISLGQDDVVLISGGARGVGFALARGLAEEFGCHVVVTGRSRLPVEESWLSADDEAYADYRRQRIALAGSANALRKIRTSLRRQEELRAVYRNLTDAAGLRITYESCDVADRAQVAALFERIPAPAVIVHNAGIDEPKRLHEKSADEVVRTVDVKVTGFANLMGEVLGRGIALKAWCNVGSLAGRLGGMIGQVDYAAGNEALTRLGFWARDAHGLPVQTLCWPTWERLGVIANYDAAVRYVSTIAPDEGVRRWIAEISAASTGEVMFIGQIGTALVPSMLRGFWLFTGHPDLPRLHSLAHFLGDIEEFEPFRQLRCTVRYSSGSHPCLNEVHLDGRPILPVSVLIEQACAVADWVSPPGWPPQHLAEVRDVVIDPTLLLLDQTFSTHAVGEMVGQEWLVDVRVTVGQDVVGSLRLVYRATPPELTAQTRPVEGSPHVMASAGALSWSGLVLPRPRWSADSQGRVATTLTSTTPADLWTAPFPPEHGIAPAAIEAALQACQPTGRVRIRRIVVCPGAQHIEEMHGSADRQHWLGVRAGVVVLEIDGLMT